jgi:4-carboxymuconolactone decarboxylase
VSFAKYAVAVCVLFSFSGSARAQDRMPPIPAGKMTDAQKKVAEELVAGPRGALVGPFIPLLRSPEFMSRLQKTGAYLRFGSSLPPKVNEFVILLTSRQWTQQFEWDAHIPLALKAGVQPEVLKAMSEGRRPVGMDPDEELAYDFSTELHQNESVSDATYERAVKRFGEQGVIDMVGLRGYYSMLAMIMNVARTPLPEGRTPQLVFFPH